MDYFPAPNVPKIMGHVIDIALFPRRFTVTKGKSDFKIVFIKRAHHGECIFNTTSVFWHLELPLKAQFKQKKRQTHDMNPVTFGCNCTRSRSHNKNNLWYFYDFCIIICKCVKSLLEAKCFSIQPFAKHVPNFNISSMMWIALQYLLDPRPSILQRLILFTNPELTCDLNSFMESFKNHHKVQVGKWSHSWFI